MVSTPTDTIVSGTVTYTGIAGFQPYVSLNANLPTGQTVLKGATANARMDPDIVDIATFGEGWNIGPTIGANFPITDSTTLSFGAGHTVRGPYDKEGFTDPNALVRIDPGDVTTLNASISTESGKFSFEGSASYSWESVTYRLGSPSFKLGDRYLVSGTAGYAWTDASKSIVTVSWSANKRNKIINTEINDLITEAFNSNNNVYRARIDHLFTVGGWVVGPTANYMLRDVNSYSPSTLQFVPAKTRWGAGATVKHKLNKQVDLNASIERMWIKESANVGSNIPDLSIDGWAFVVGGVLRY
jgi:hypothetical protein